MMSVPPNVRIASPIFRRHAETMKLHLAVLSSHSEIAAVIELQLHQPMSQVDVVLIGSVVDDEHCLLRPELDAADLVE